MSNLCHLREHLSDYHTSICGMKGEKKVSITCSVYHYLYRGRKVIEESEPPGPICNTCAELSVVYALADEYNTFQSEQLAMGMKPGE